MCKSKIQMMGVWWCGIRLCLSGGLIIRHFDMSVASPSSNSVHESNCTCVSQWPRTLRPEAIFFSFSFFTESLQSKVNPQHKYFAKAFDVRFSFVSLVSFFQYTFLLQPVFRWCYGSKCSIASGGELLHGINHRQFRIKYQVRGPIRRSES